MCLANMPQYENVLRLMKIFLVFPVRGS